MATLEKIAKSSTAILEKITKGVGILGKISKISAGNLEKITKNISHLLYFRLLESSETAKQIIRITEDGEKRILEDSPSDTGINITKNTATLEKILKS